MQIDLSKILRIHFMNIINIHMIKIDIFLKKLFLDIFKHEILIVTDESSV
jgi:hypothetical protein